MNDALTSLGFGLLLISIALLVAAIHSYLNGMARRKDPAAPTAIEHPTTEQSELLAQIESIRNPNSGWRPGYTPRVIGVAGVLAIHGVWVSTVADGTAANMYWPALFSILFAMAVDPLYRRIKVASLRRRLTLRGHS